MIVNHKLVFLACFCEWNIHSSINLVLFKSIDNIFWHIQLINCNECADIQSQYNWLFLLICTTEILFFGFLILTLISRLLIVCIWRSGVFDLLLPYVLWQDRSKCVKYLFGNLVNRLRNLEKFWSSLIWYATTLFSLIYVQFDFLKKKDRTIIQTVFWSDSSSLWNKKIKNYSSKISTLRHMTQFIIVL